MVFDQIVPLWDADPGNCNTRKVICCEPNGQVGFTPTADANGETSNLRVPMSIFAGSIGKKSVIISPTYAQAGGTQVPKLVIDGLEIKNVFRDMRSII